MPKTIHALLSKRWLLCFVVLLGFQGVNAQLSVILNETDPACFGLASGSIVTNTSGGQIPLTYAWSNGATTPFIENLTAGTYSVTVTDANGLTGSATALLEQPPQITLNLTSDQECQEPFTLSANGGGGVFPYTYNWSTGANTQTVEVPSGTYCVTIVDANLCGTFGCITVDLNPPSVSVTSVDINCFGGEDGSLTAFPASGTPPYTYLWSNGATTQTISGLTVGTYGVTITDAGGCTASASGTVAQPTQLNVAVTQDGPVCAGDFDITITAFPTGGTPGYTYLWSTGATTQAISGFGAGTYSVTITDQNNCTVVGAATVLEAPSPDVQIIGDDVICGLGSDTELTAVPSGGTPGYQLLWSTGSVMPTITVTTPGVYSVTVTDANGCTDMAQAAVTLVNLSVTTATTNVSCFGFNDGTATVFGSGGTQPYTYMWTTGAVTQTVTGLAPGTYGFTITEADNCKASGTVTITQPAPIGITGNVTNPLCFGDASGSINVSVSGGTPPYSYSWSNGAITQDIANLSAGSYTITVTDANNCTATATFVVAQPADLTASTVVTNVDCFGDATGAIDLSVFGGTAPYTYDWSDDGNEDPDDDPEDRINLIAATYQVTVTDANGCTVVTQATVTQPPLLVLNTTSVNVDCFGQSTGSIDLTVAGGTPAYSYLWNTGSTSQDLNNLPAGTYTVTVTDANACTESVSVVIGQPSQLEISAITGNVSCFGGNDGFIDLSVSGGTPPYSYAWSNGAITQDLDNLSAGTYTGTVTDANGCTISAPVTVTEPADIVLTTLVTDVVCDGGATGAIDLTVVGGTAPYTYDWSNDGNEDPDDDTQDLDNLFAGTYSVTVTDANGCTAITSATVDALNPINLSGIVTDLDCFGDSSGAIDLMVSGGTAPYSYAWSNGVLTQDLNNLAAGTYTVIVTDINECTAEATFTVEQPDAIALNISAPTIVCGGTNSGSILANPSGGTAPYSFLWSNGAITNSINDLPAGIYGVTVTDANGCQATDNTIQLTEIPNLSCNVQVNQQPTSGNNGSLTVNVAGGTAPFTYDWSNGATTATIDGLSAGTYTVTVTDANNCTTVCSATLQPFSGIGNFVWIDADLDGLQDPGEVGFPGVTVNLKNAAGVVIATTTTDADGMYLFDGLAPGTYSVQFVPPVDWDYTASNIGADDTIDSDIIPGMLGMTGTYDLDPGEFDLTVDAGLIFIEGIISDPCACLNNATTDTNGQFSEEIMVTTFSGLTWTIIEQMNMYVNDPTNNPPSLPVLVPIGTVLQEFPIGGGLSEYIIQFRLVDELTYSVVLQAGEQTLSISNTCFYPEIFFVDPVPEELCVFDEAFPLDADTNIDGDFTYTISGQTVTAIDPATLPPGTYDLEVILVPFDTNECEAILIVSFDISNNCPAKLGDFVWEDLNFNGIQDPGEPGISGVTVTVSSQDGTYTDTQQTDANGMYMFMVDPGTYKLTFEQPLGFVPSPQNQGGNDAIDSDVDPVMLMTDFVTVGPDEMNFTIDAGFYNECIANVTDPGTIGFDQELCGAGNVPDLLVELTPAQGGVGELNYLWMKNTVDPNQNIAFWTPVPNSNSPNLQLGPVYESTYYARCVRRNNCVFIESNTVFIEVGNDAEAIIQGVNVICEQTTTTYTAANANGASNIEWSFSGPANVTNNPDGSVDVFWGSFGIFSVTLSVTQNGCTATRTKTVTVLGNPASCGGDNFSANGTVNSLVARDVSINWMLPMDGSPVEFTVERSIDGNSFQQVGAVQEPIEMVNGNTGSYRFDDVSPYSGVNYYRVWLHDSYGNSTVSNTVELFLSNGSSQLAQIYPNPAQGNNIHVQMLSTFSSSNQTTVQLYSSTGNLIASQPLSPGANTLDLAVTNQPSGVYFVRVINGDSVETHQVIID